MKPLAKNKYGERKFAVREALRFPLTFGEREFAEKRALRIP